MGWGSSARRSGVEKFVPSPGKFVVLELRGREPGMSQKFCRDVIVVVQKSENGRNGVGKQGLGNQPHISEKARRQ